MQHYCGDDHGYTQSDFVNNVSVEVGMVGFQPQEEEV